MDGSGVFGERYQSVIDTGSWGRGEVEFGG